MREVMKGQASLGEVGIEAIVLDPKSRDDIPKLLVGLQYIFVNRELRNEVFDILQEVIPTRADGNKASPARGRPGMDQWKILVLGVIRLGLDADYDRVQELANQHQTLRQMLGHADWSDRYTYELQTLKDNLRLFTPEILGRINLAVVRAGHRLVSKGSDDTLRGRCDSFVVETDVHFPTDTSLLYDAIRKAIECCADLSDRLSLAGWRQSRYNLRQFKKAYHKARRLKRSTSKKESQREARTQEIQNAHRDYLNDASRYLERAKQTRGEVVAAPTVSFADIVTLGSLDEYVAHAERQIDQIRRRVLEGEVIPHAEKVFSIFEPHTEWIVKGKAGVPVELGLRVALIEDQHGFLLHHRVMEKETDDHVAVPIVDEAQAHFPRLRGISFDRGFHSVANRKALEKQLDVVAMPKKGRLSAEDHERESEPEFVRARRQHSAVESAINGLEHFGLDLCPDHGLRGFKRYVALAVLARNIHHLGVIVRERNARAKPRAPTPLPLAA